MITLVLSLRFTQVTTPNSLMHHYHMSLTKERVSQFSEFSVYLFVHVLCQFPLVSVEHEGNLKVHFLKFSFERKTFVS